MKRISMLIIALCFGPGVAGAALISSTPAGGFWAVGSTWVGGVVPGPGDEVVVAGPVIVTGAPSCASLSVSAAGLLRSGASGPATLSVSGAAANAGQIANGSAPYTAFTLDVGGDLTSGGTWTNLLTRITGADDRHLQQMPGALFASDLVFAPGAAGDLLLDTPLAMSGDLDLGGGRLVAAPACPLTVNDGRISGQLMLNGNALHAEGYSYLQGASLDAAELHGDMDIAWATFTGGLRVIDGLRPSALTGGGHATIAGGLVNEGLIANTTYGLTIDLAGDLENNGIIRNSWIQFDGAGVQHLSGAPGGLFDVSMFLPEFQGGDLVADTPLRLADGLQLAGGTLTLAPGADIRLVTWGSISGGTLYADGNTIRMNGSAALGDLTIDQAVLAGTVQIQYAADFTGGLTVGDTLQAWESGFGTVNVSVAGLLRNTGVVRDSGQQPLALRLLGDLENAGSMTNARSVVAGDADQHIGIGAGIATPEFVLESGLSAASYQWFKDGQPLAGETAATLTLAGVGAADHGRYHCEGDALVSRSIWIAEHADPTAAPPPTLALRLAQNHPNPFNPATTIAFSLPAAGPVRLSIHDAAGREVARLLDGPLAAGEHRVEWRPLEQASGVYLYRLMAGGELRLGKCTLLK